MDNEIALFMSKLKELAQGAEKSVSVAQIRQHFSGMDLDEAQMRQIVDYLGSCGVVVEGATRIRQQTRMEGDVDLPEPQYDLTDMDLPQELPDNEMRRTLADDLKKTPLFGQKELKTRLHAAREGDTKAWDELSRYGMRLTFAIAKTFYTPKMGSGFYDLLQEGNIAFLTAISKYRPEMAVDFRDYASYRIRQAVLRCIAQNTKDSSFASDTAALLNRMNDAVKELSEDLGMEPTAQEVSDYIDVPLWKMKRAQDFSDDKMNLIFPKDMEEKKELTPQQRIEIEDILPEMNPREAGTLSYRFGLCGHRPHSADDTGRVYGISEDHVRQVLAKALRIVRQEKSS